MLSAMSPQDAWQATLGQLELQLNRSTFETWVKGAELLGYEDGTFAVQVKNAYARDWLEKRLYGSIHRTLTDIFGRSVEVRFMVYDPVDEPEDFGPLWEEEDLRQELVVESQLNPRHLFDNFIVGNSNQLAVAAARAVADNPGGAYNPLFVYGDVGLGKTHLLHAIGNACLEHRLRVMYVTSEQFTNELILAIREQSTNAFRDHYRTLDVLLVDDIQFIAGKDSTQEEFFHTFNALHSANHQIVLASDRRPRAMPTLEARLRSRFEWGLMADIQPPALEMRTAILTVKAEERGMFIPEDLAQIVARSSQGSVRELESVLTQVMAQTQLTHQPLSAELVRRVLKEYRAPRRIHSVEAVLEVAAEYHGLLVDDLVGKRRTKHIALARQQAMFLAREATDASLPKIGAAIGGRDHTTIMHGCSKISDLLEVDEYMRHEIKQLRLRLFEDDE